MIVFDESKHIIKAKKSETTTTKTEEAPFDDTGALEDSPFGSTSEEFEL